ncbi:MAG: site-2 protease family protein [Clostridia bacterium]|nr:site-2 protease family protein [Clostridia bacterium]
MSVLPLAINVQLLWGKVWPILLAILFFGIIIALHEFGHFITAKLFKVRVNEFAIGMGPALFKKRKGQKIRFFPSLMKEKKSAKDAESQASEAAILPDGVGETEYSLRLLPIGGFCAMEGENGDSTDESAFCSKKPWQRLIVLAAGASFNIILGLVLISVMLFSDGTVLSNKISYVSDAVAAAQNTLLVGDEIIKVDGTRVYSTRDLSYCLFYRSGADGADLTVRRNGETIVIENFIFDDTNDVAPFYFAVTQNEVTILNCGVYAVKETAAMAKLVYLSLIDMIGGQYGLDDLSGPIGTVNIVAETASQAVTQQDYSSVLFLLAFITVNIGLVNLLPLPALDGGRIFFVLIEMIIRKPVPQKFEALVHAVGMILLLGLMALICFNDIKNLVVN